MNLHEYQGKQLLKLYNVPVPDGILITNHSEALSAAGIIYNNTHTDKWAVKAQIHAGGRGKAGGVKIAQTLEQVADFSKNMIGMTLITHQTGAEGKLVRNLLIEENIYYKGNNEISELYISIMLDRSTSMHVIIYSPKGGMDIEQVAKETPELIYKEYIEPSIGIQTFQCRRIAFNIGLNQDAYKNMVVFIQKLYETFTSCDASLLEINPVVKTSDNKIVAADCKMTIDDNALFRHPQIMSMRDIYEEAPAEVEAKRYGLNYIKLTGNVGCMVNGAGLAMATMDIIKMSGGEPANFLDVGGSADAHRVENAFRIILQDSNVKAILVNIFGGIVRCDRVAKGIIDAYSIMEDISVPVIVRLQGTNAEEAKEMIDNSGLKVYSAIFLEEAAALIKKLVN